MSSPEPLIVPASGSAPAAARTSAGVPDATRLSAAGIRFLLIGFSIGFGLGLLLLEQRALYIASNELVADERTQLMLFMLLGGVAGILPPLTYLLVTRSSVAVRNLERIARWLSPLMLSFLLPLLFDWRVFQAHELVFVVVATLFGLGLERLLRTTYSELPWARLTQALAWLKARFPRTLVWTPRLLLGAMVLFFCAYFSFYSVRQHYRLMTYSWDMAIFDNMMWNLIRGHWFKATPDLGLVGSHIQYHATFGAYLYAPFYAICQRPETLLVMQASLVGLGAIPYYLVGKRRIGSSLGGLVVAYAYLMHAPLHSPIFYDFHFLTMAPFWIGWVLYFFETDRRWPLVVAWLCAISLREEISAGLAMAALFYLMSGRRPLLAVAGGVLSASYFVLTKFYIMPLHRTAGPDSQTFGWMFYALSPHGEAGFGGVLKTILSNPVFTLGSLLNSDKLLYVLRLFGPVLLLPFRHRLTWVMFVHAFLFTAFSTGYMPLVQPYFQYTSNYTPFLFFAVTVAIGALREGEHGRERVASALTATAVAATIFSYNFGAILQTNSFRAGFHKVSFALTPADIRKHDQLYELIAMIPKDASVAATEYEAPHVSSRANCFTMRLHYENAEYLLVNLDEASVGITRHVLTTALKTGRYAFVASRGRYALWSSKVKRTRATDKKGNALLRLPPPPASAAPRSGSKPSVVPPAPSGGP